MKIQGLRTVAGMLSWIMAFSLAGCRTAPPAASADIETEAQSADIPDEAREVADASLGKQAEILTRGNLAQNGREQVLVINRFSAGAQASKESASSSAIFVTRAAILEKNDGKWAQVLLCDEHLKNPKGYLGGSPAARVNGWRLEYSQDERNGLEMRFTPAEKFDAFKANTEERSKARNATLDVRWNKNAKRYQSFDQSHERYLNEVPSLETPQSTLR
jgi:hypothetical protein